MDELTIILVLLVATVLIAFVFLYWFQKLCCGHPESREDGVATFIPSESVEIDITSDKAIQDLQTRLQREEENLPQESKEKLRETNDLLIRKAQEILLTRITSEHRLSSSENCSLIIGVDATPGAQAGYCVLLPQKKLNFYIIKRDDFPWALALKSNPSEFEMRNLIFALILWKNLIFKYKRFRLFTDNHAINFHNRKTDQFGQEAYQLLNHLTSCSGSSQVLNADDLFVNKFKNLKSFAKFLQPADDLSRWHINIGIDFLIKMYGIDKENIEGTHSLTISPRRNRKPWYPPTPTYQQVIRTVQNGIDDLSCPSNTECNHVLNIIKNSRRN